MSARASTGVVLRHKRQITLPREVCDRLGIGPGDVLELAVEDSVLVATPRKAVALQALKEIQEAFLRSGITEAEIQKTGRRTRREIATGRYGGRS